jgi:hypothetical protein
LRQGPRHRAVMKRYGYKIVAGANRQAITIAVRVAA